MCTIFDKCSCMLGLSSDLSCIYNPREPFVYFTLGEAVAALAIIFVVYQFRSPLWDITLSVRKWVKWVVYSLLSLGVFSVLMASLIPQFPYYSSVPLLSYPLFWEILGLFAFTSSPIILIGFAHKLTGLFSEYKAGRLFNVLLEQNSTMNVVTHKAVADVLRDNMEDICKATSIYNRWKAHLAQESEIKYEYPEYSQISFEILHVVMGDHGFLNYVVTSRYDLLSRYIYFVDKYKLWDARIHNGFDAVVKVLFENRQSYLYREMEYTGIGYYEHFTKQIFFNQKIVTELRPLQAWLCWERSDGYIDKLRLYLKCLEMAITGYWDNNNVRLDFTPFTVAYDNLEHIALSTTLEIADVEGKRIWRCSENKILEELSRFIGRTFPNLYKEALDKKAVGQNDIDVSVDPEHDYINKSLTAAYANLVFEYLSVLSSINGHFVFVRHHAMEATGCLIGILSKDDSIFANIRSRLIKLLWDRIAENLEDHYAPVIKIYLMLICGKYSKDEPQWMSDERKKLIGLLYEKVLPSITNDPTKADRLLPQDVTYDKDNNSFYYHYRSTKEQLIVS